MSMTTPLLDTKRILEQLLRRLPRYLRDRLLSLRLTYPKTPLQSLPQPVRAEVKQILTSAGVTTTPSPSFRPAAPQGQAQPEAPHATTAPPHNRAARTPDVSILGTDVTTGRDIVISQKARQQGLYVIGTNGTGKTTLLEHLALDDARNGRGFCIVEPHGDLTAKILGGIPRHRINDVYYLDVEDVEFPFGLGLFEVAYPRTIRSMAATASFISHLWEVIWHAGTDTPRLMQNLRAVTRTLISNPCGSFADIPLLYANEIVRERMLANVDNPQILAYWEGYERMNQRDRQAYTESTLNKVTAFLDEPMIAHILSQTKTTIDFRYIMDNKKILLIKLSPQYEEASRLIGAVVIGKILMTAFSRSDTPEEKRKDFYLYCDEYHRFSSSDFSTLISESRKFRISTCISHQALRQVSEINRASALGAGNIICFRVSGEDAHVLCRSFDTTPTEQIVINGEEPIRAPVADVITHLVKRGHTDQRLTGWANKFLSPFETYCHTKATERWACRFECHAGALILSDFQGQTARAELNDCLYRCMVEKNAAISIPPLALYVLAVSQGQSIEYLFSPYIITPGIEWLSPHTLKEFDQRADTFGRVSFITPESATSYINAVPKRCKWMAEALITLLTELRTAMTLLQQSPIMVDTGQYRPRQQTQVRTYQDMENQVARDLANAPNYTAKVKLVSGGEYVIRTKPAPQTITGAALTERIEAIKRHMQALGVIRHYTEVEREARVRQQRLLGITAHPEDTDLSADRQGEQLPSDSFSLE